MHLLPLLPGCPTTNRATVPPSPQSLVPLSPSLCFVACAPGPKFSPSVEDRAALGAAPLVLVTLACLLVSPRSPCRARPWSYRSWTRLCVPPLSNSRCEGPLGTSLHMTKNAKPASPSIFSRNQGFY